LYLLIVLIAYLVFFSLSKTGISPSCGSGDEDMRPSITKYVDFLHFAAILSIISAVLMVAISLMTTPRPDRKWV
jgi:hypothetical protein